MISFEWRDLMWILGVGTAAAGGLIAFVRWKLAGDFAKAGDMAAISARLGVVEARLAQMPDHKDLQGLQARIGELERNVAVVGEKVTGTIQIMTRVERQLHLVSDHLIRESR